MWLCASKDKDKSKIKGFTKESEINSKNIMKNGFEKFGKEYELGQQEYSFKTKIKLDLKNFTITFKT